MSTNPFNQIALYYDWEHDDFQDDLPLYLGLASRVSGPILEVACGSGRLLLPFAQHGLDVVGVDSSPAMLDLARARLADGEVASRVQLIQGDFVSTRLERQFGLVVLGLDSFGLVLEPDRQLEALRNLRDHLSYDGLLVIDVANGNQRGGEATEETVLQLARPDPRSGRQIVKWVLRRTDHAEQLDQLLKVYDETGDDGLVRRTTAELELHYFTRFELQHLVQRAGLAIENLLGDYDLSPFGPNSQRLIVVAHAAEGPGAQNPS
jgi:SAM-dependent methyltransferase